MLSNTNIDFKQAGVLNSLVLNYIQKDSTLTPFYNKFPDRNGFADLLGALPYKDFNRAELVSILRQQSSLVGNTKTQSLANISKLGNNHVFTVTTGHQLCLFTGPLYFIYKLFSTINLAEQLSREFPEYGFVPVYWMASEDHDFEEVNNFNLFGKNIKWLSQQGGAVGDFNTNELGELMPAIKEVFGTGEHASALLNLFEEAYLKHNTLANATRFLVNELFGNYGLVIVDGNDKAFKKQFIPQFKKDIFENDSFKQVDAGIKGLAALGYEAQVNPRPINCFLIEKGNRNRIEKSGDNYTLVGTQTFFTRQQLEEIIEQQTEKISPNVVLRPLYQQAILPNIAYVGGPGELAYWLEYKSMFEYYQLLFPLLVPRNFILVVDKALKTKINKLNFTEADFFKSETELIQEFQVKSNAVFDLEKEKEKLNHLYKEIGDKLTGVDKTLAGSVLAELQKSSNGLDMLSGKANKALKQKSETELNQIKGLKQKLFPGGVPQERHENFATFYLKYGTEFLTAVKNAIQPLQHKQLIISEE